MTPDALTARGVQVPPQFPSRRAVKGSGGSPLENVLTTDPAVNGSPQSLTTAISRALGHEAGTLKLLPSEVNKGTSFVGMHPPARCSFGEPASGAERSTSATLTMRTDPSPNRRVMDPCQTPRPRPAMFG